jgi:cytochrome P450
MRKTMSHAFSETALREQLTLVASHMRRFSDRIRAIAEKSKSGKVDLNEWFNYLAFDVVTDLSFGDPLGALEIGAPDPYIEGFFSACRMFIVIPMMHEYYLFNLFFKGMMKIPAVRKSQEMGYLATKNKVEKRINTKTDRKDFMTYILRHNDEKGMSNAEIVGSTTVLVNAGGEATAATMGAAIYYMLKNPHTLETAKQEVRRAFASEEAIMSTTSHGLTYLNAVIEEVFRIYAPAPGNFARRTNLSTQIDGYMVPKNVSLFLVYLHDCHYPY